MIDCRGQPRAQSRSVRNSWSAGPPSAECRTGNYVSPEGSVANDGDKTILVGNRHTWRSSVEASPEAGDRTDASLASTSARHQGRPAGSLALVGTGRADRRIWRAKILRRRPQRLPHMPLIDRAAVSYASGISGRPAARSIVAPQEAARHVPAWPAPCSCRERCCHRCRSNANRGAAGAVERSSHPRGSLR